MARKAPKKTKKRATTWLQVRTTPEDERILRKLQRHHGLDKSAVFRQAIREMLANITAP